MGLGTATDSGRSDLNLSSRKLATRRFTGLNGRIHTIGTGIAPVVLSVGVEKDVEIMYDEAQPGPRCIKFGSSSLPLTPNPLPRAQDGGERQADIHKYYIQQSSFPPPQDARMIEMDRIGTTMV